MQPHSIVPPTPEGKSIGAWVMDWSVWADNVPFPQDAHSDTTGANANNEQPDGPVFFLGQTIYGDTFVERTFTVPAGKYILAPLMALWAAEGYGDKQCATPEGCRQVIADAFPLIDDLFYGIDGLNGFNFFLHREPSPDVFQYEIGKNNPWGYPSGPTGNVFSDGYWIMLAPLSEGERLDLVYGGGISSISFSYRITAHITGVPVDCNANGYLDSCDISCTAPGGECDPLHCFVSDDCDGNLIPDECDPDCWPTDAPNGNPDYCDVLNCPAGDATCADCNGNRVPDECDTFIGFSQDCQSDGIPDDCQTLGAVSAWWTAGSGNWNVGANWCPSLTPDFPDNRVGTNYDVTIEGASSVITLNTSPSVDSLSLTEGATVVVSDAGGANVRTLHSDGDINNRGVFRATDRERLVLDTSLIDQGGQCGVGGALEAIDGALGEGEETDKSILEINGARVLGGIARTIGQNSEIHLIGGAELVNVCVDGVVIPDGQTGAFSGTMTNHGIMSVRGTTLDTRLDPRSADAVLEGGGSVQLTSQSLSRLGDFKSSFTNSKTHRIEGGGLVYGGMINDGTVRADLPGQHLILSPPGIKRNDGLFLATGGGTLRLADDVSGSGRYEAADGGAIVLAPSDEFVSVDGAAVKVWSYVRDASGTFTVGSNSALNLFGGITVEPGGVFEAAGNGVVRVGNVTIDGSDACCPACNVAGGRTPPVTNIRDQTQVTVGGATSMLGSGADANSSSAGVSLEGNWVLLGSVDTENTSSESVSLVGNWDNQATCPALFDWTAGGLALSGSGPQRFEVAGRDLGRSRTGLGNATDSNFAMRRVEIMPGRDVTFADAFDNGGDGQPPCSEALYVHELTLGAGSAVTFNDCRVHYDLLIDEGATITRIGCGDLQQLPSGDTNGDRRVDLLDWNLLPGACLHGPDDPTPMPSNCAVFNFDADPDIDLADVAWFQRLFNGP